MMTGMDQYVTGKDLIPNCQADGAIGKAGYI